MEKWKKKVMATLLVAIVLNVLLCLLIFWGCSHISKGMDSVARHRVISLAKLHDSDLPTEFKDRILQLDQATSVFETGISKDLIALNIVSMLVIGLNIPFSLYCLTTIRKTHRALASDVPASR